MRIAPNLHPIRRLSGTVLTLALALVLGACGGTSNRDLQSAAAANSSAANTAATAAAAVEVVTSANTVASTGAEALITAYIKTPSNVALEGQTVSFAADSGNLQVVSATSDASGAVSAKLSAGGNKAQRNITVTVTAGAASGNVVVGVTGSALSIAGSASLQVGAAATSYTVRAQDSGGVGVANVAISASSALGNLIIAPATTDSTGTATLSYTPTHAGTDTITVAGLGTQTTTSVLVNATNISVTSPASMALVPVVAGTTFSIHVSGAGSGGQSVTFNTTRGGVSPSSTVLDGSGNASTTITSNTAGPATVSAVIAGIGQVNLPVVFTAVTPSSVVVQANPSTVQPNTGSSTSNQSAIQAVVRDANNNAVAGTTVNFNLVTDTSGGSLSQASATTDSNGRAQVQFIPGPSVTPLNGVSIQASAGSASGTAALSVSGQALFITINFGNTVSDVDTTAYTKPFSVNVTDTNGNAVQNQNLTLSVIPETYFKGVMTFNAVAAQWQPVYSVPSGCVNEDTNLNGILDTGEDTNGNGKLDPGNPATVSPGTVTTDSTGRATFDLLYGKRFATWLSVRITARGTVAGTESSQSVLMTLPIALADIGDSTVPPAGVTSPFGTANACNNPN